MTVAAASKTFLTAADQNEVAPNVSFRPERIQAAFFGVPAATAEPKSRERWLMDVQGQNTILLQRRGIRLSAPLSKSRLIGFVTEQRWQGYILNIKDDGQFSARVFDMTSAEDSIEDAEFDENDVPELMRHLIRPGAIFNWDIGFQVDPSGGRIRQSLLSFPMIPKQTEADIIAAKNRALKRFSDLGWGKRSDAGTQSPKERSGE